MTRKKKATTPVATAPAKAPQPAPYVTEQERAGNQPSRKMKLLQWDWAFSTGTVLMTEAGETEGVLYHISRTAPTTVLFQKMLYTGGVQVCTPRTVTLTGTTPTAKCNCPGFVRHKKCRHASATLRLVADRRI